MARIRNGFTLVEMLAVLAIIMILAAILLPVLGRAREQSHRTQCMSNLHQIAMALRMYKLDQRGFPMSLDEQPIAPGDRWFGSQDATTGLPDRQRPGYGLAGIYPDYIESARVFACPNNEVDVLTDKGDPIGDTSQTTAAATYQSYDGLDTLPHGSSQSPKETLKYCRFWRAAPPVGTLDPDFRRQLTWRYPPDDTVVTWCVYHRKVSDPSDPQFKSFTDQRGSWDIVLFLDGTTRTKLSIGESGHSAVPGDGG